MTRMQWFIENYVPKDKEVKVLDIGSCNVNGCYKPLFSGTKAKYVGLDICSGNNVDIVVNDPYNWSEIEDISFDFIISGNAFEHIEFPWLTIKEIYKKLKPEGFVCILTPFALGEHRYPTDCYRYYSDGLIALAKWANLAVVECTVGGIPKGTTELKWSDKNENYDDTMLVACKTNDSLKLKDLPRFNATLQTREWKIK